MAQHFRSKRDSWLTLLVWLAVLFSLISLVPILFYETGIGIRLVTLFFIVLTPGLVGWVFWGTGYQVDETTLTIDSGPFHWRIPLHDIRAVTPSRALWSSPALSLDRLRIDYGEGRFILVSPLQRDAFIAALKLDDTNDNR